jgi:SAM-dependent methyltransferase
MHLDILDLREFYADRLGSIARRLISTQIRRAWGNVSGETVIGLGYAAPYLRVFLGEALRLGAFMPAAQGVVHWPAEPPNRAALVDEFDLPLGDATVDRLLLVHMLEMTEAPHELLREAWRVLAPGGRLIIVVPNRRGVWARFDSTPFGHGRPFSRGQMTTLLRNAMLEPVHWTSALALPPTRRRFWLRYAAALERVRAFVMPGFEGVLIVEAGKQMYAAAPVRGTRKFAGRLRPALAPPGSTSMPVKRP